MNVHADTMPDMHTRLAKLEAVADAAASLIRAEAEEAATDLTMVPIAEFQRIKNLVAESKGRLLGALDAMRVPTITRERTR